MRALILIIAPTILAVGVGADGRFGESCRINTKQHPDELHLSGPWLKTTCDHDGDTHETEINLSYCLGVGKEGDLRPKK
jgi:hypothetical protein